MVPYIQRQLVLSGRVTKMNFDFFRNTLLCVYALTSALHTNWLQTTSIKNYFDFERREENFRKMDLSKFKEFLENSTIHGLVYISRAK